MTAIAGLWSFDSAIAPAKTCSRMIGALSMYGGGDDRQFADDRVAMGCCLSGLLPEDRFDTQPLSRGGASALVADLRLDNRAELIRDLKIPNGAAIADSEILLSAWLAWGEGCLQHLLGAFSFAVWNSQEQHLFLARDHVGERPLFYSLSGNCFAFASMPKGLHLLPFVGAEVDEDYVANYLAMVLTPTKQTIFRRIVRLPAGSALSVRPGRTQVWKYWRPEQLPELRLGSDEEYLELLRERLDDAVRSRLRTTGKIGTQLSGGLDSAAVAATAARLLGAEGREITAYTAIPRADFQRTENPDYFEDEGPAAAEVAALYPNLHHVLVDSSHGNFLDLLDLTSSLYDHPCFAPLNEVWSTEIEKRAQESGITVLLNGNCGNSTFSPYGMPVLSAWLRSGRWWTLARVAWQIRRTHNASLKSILRNALGPSLPFGLRRRLDPHMRDFSLAYCALHPEIVRRMDLERKALRDTYLVPEGGRFLLSMMLEYGEVGETSVAPQAGWRMDSPDPMYDSRMVEFAMTVPLEQFVRGGQLRSLARRSMVDRLPASTLACRKRGRQAADWPINLTRLRGQIMAEVEALEGSPLATRMLDTKRLRQIVESWPTGGFERPEVQGPYYNALPRALSVGRFLRKFDPQVSS